MRDNFHLLAAALRKSAALLAGFCILGLSAGLIVGGTGSEATVVSTLVPAILTLGGGLLLLKADLFSSNIRLLFLSSFCAALFAGAWIASDARETKLKEAEEWHFILCAEREQRVNAYRVAILKLPPLESKVFCGE